MADDLPAKAFNKQIKYAYLKGEDPPSTDRT